MRIHVSGKTQESIERRLAAGQFQSPEEVVEAAMRQWEKNESPTMESLQAKLQEGLDDETAERVAPLDVEDIKKRGRDRLAQT